LSGLRSAGPTVSGRKSLTIGASAAAIQSRADAVRADGFDDFASLRVSDAELSLIELARASGRFGDSRVAGEEDIVCGSFLVRTGDVVSGRGFRIVRAATLHRVT
jgi:hypothetical protein